jgi:hypothetical protein
LTTFVNTLRNYGIKGVSWSIFNVTLAHRDNELGIHASRSNPNLLPNTITNAWFTYPGSPPAPSGKNAVDLNDFAVVYMFGFSVDQSTSNLCWDGAGMEDQVWAFVQFMQNGVGIFATGDLEDRGAALCGSIPRVRSMRRWWWDHGNPINVDFAADEEGPYGNQSYGISFVNSVEVKHSFNREPYQSLGDLCSPPAFGETGNFSGVTRRAGGVAWGVTPRGPGDRAFESWPATDREALH